MRTKVIHATARLNAKQLSTDYTAQRHFSDGLAVTVMPRAAYVQLPNYLYTHGSGKTRALRYCPYSREYYFIYKRTSYYVKLRVQSNNAIHPAAMAA